MGFGQMLGFRRLVLAEAVRVGDNDAEGERDSDIEAERVPVTDTDGATDAVPAIDTVSLEVAGSNR
jgi:hypothetical protein